MIYLETPIAEAKRTVPPQPRLDRYGYTLKQGSPTSIMLRLDGEKRWRRLMAWQLSNAGTLFVRIKGASHIVREHDLPPIAR